VALIDRLAARRGRQSPAGDEPVFDEMAAEAARRAEPRGVERQANGAEAEAPPVAIRTASGDPIHGPLAPELAEARAEIHGRLVDRHADEIDITDRDTVRRLIASLTEAYFRESALPITRLDFQKLVDAVFDEVCGLGPLQPLLEDDTITEIMINHPRQVFVERRGRVTLSAVTFDGDRQLKQVIDRIVTTVGRRIDESSPMCDARLKDGSRVNAVIPPLAVDGPCLTIRKFSRDRLEPSDLIASGGASPAMLWYLEAAVRSKLNILVAGGTSSGKTTLLNILSGFIPGDERVITIEDAAELQLRQVHVIRMESRPPNVEGKGAVEIRDLVRNSLRMRPDRIVVGECRGGEALDMLQAMNTGHEGSLSTIHANTPADALTRLETMVLMAGTDLPARAIQKQIASAVDVIVQAQRLRGGARKIVSITEITGLVDGEFRYHEVFRFRQVGLDDDGAAIGSHVATGIPSAYLERFASVGESVPASIFDTESPPERPAP
jgi:pilus assembly protein CpaF